jgi:hypothetical protein
VSLEAKGENLILKYGLGTYSKSHEAVKYPGTINSEIRIATSPRFSFSYLYTLANCVRILNAPNVFHFDDR